MTPYKLPRGQKGFADLGQQICEQVGGKAVPATEIDKPPTDTNGKIKRLTLHLDSLKTRNLKAEC